MERRYFLIEDLEDAQMFSFGDLKHAESIFKGIIESFNGKQIDLDGEIVPRNIFVSREIDSLRLAFSDHAPGKLIEGPGHFLEVTKQQMSGYFRITTNFDDILEYSSEECLGLAVNQVLPIICLRANQKRSII